MRKMDRSAPDPRALGWSLIMLAAGLSAGAAGGLMALFFGQAAGIMLALFLIPLVLLTSCERDMLGQAYHSLVLGAGLLGLLCGAMAASPWWGVLGGGLGPAALLVLLLA